MFSENGKISQRQLYRMIIVASLGASLLICPRLLGKYGSWGILAYLLAGGMSALYILGISKLRKLVLGKLILNERVAVDNAWEKINCNENVSEKFDRAKFVLNIFKGFLGTIAFIRLFIVAVGGLFIMYDVVQKILLPRTNGLMILFLVGVLLVYWMGSGLECTARAMELLFYWVLGPIVISLAVVIPNVELGNIFNENVSGSVNIFEENMDVASSGGFDSNTEAINDGVLVEDKEYFSGSILGENKEDFSGSGLTVKDTLVESKGTNIFEILFSAFIIFIIYTPAELIFLCKEDCDCKKLNKPIWRAFIFFWIANVMTYVIVLGIYGAKGLNVYDNYPSIKVMQISGVPGDFLRRVDGFMGAFLVVSLFCGIALALVILKMMVESLAIKGKCINK